MFNRTIGKRVVLVTPLGSQPWCSSAELGNELRRLGHTVAITGDGPDHVFPWPEQYRPRVGVRSRTTIGMAVAVSRIAVRWALAIRRFFRREQPDVIVVWDPMIAALCRVVRGRRRRVVFVASEYPPVSLQLRIERAVAIAFADAVVVTTSAGSTINMARHVVADPVDGPPVRHIESGDGWVVLAGGVITDARAAVLAERARVCPAAAVVLDARNENELPADSVQLLTDASGTLTVERVVDSRYLVRHRVAAVFEPAAVLWTLDHRHRGALASGVPIYVGDDVLLGPEVVAYGVSAEIGDGPWRTLVASRPVVNDLTAWAVEALRDPSHPRAGVVATSGVTVALCPMCRGADRREVRRIGPTTVVRCDACGLTYGTPKVPDEVVYDAGYHFGTGRFGTDYANARWYCDALSEDRLSFVRAAGIHAESMLDIGTGLGHFVQRARAHGWRCDGLELVPEAVEGARRLFGLELINDRVTEFRAREKYDVAALGQTLEHFTEPVDVLEHIRKEIIRPGGALLVEVPNVDGLPRRLRRSHWTHWQIGDHVSFFNPRTLTEMLDRAGFDVLRTETTTAVYPGIGAVGVAYALGMFDPLTTWGSSLRTARRVVRGRLRRLSAVGAEDGPARVASTSTIAERVLLTVARAADRAGLGDHVRVVAIAR